MKTIAHIGLALLLCAHAVFENRNWATAEDDEFYADDFLEATGESENILHIAPTFSFKF